MFTEYAPERVGLVLEEHHLRTICEALCQCSLAESAVSEVLALMHNAASTVRWINIAKR